MTVTVIVVAKAISATLLTALDITKTSRKYSNYFL